MEAKDLTQLLTVNPAIIYVIEKENGNYKPTWISRNISRILGYPPVAALSKNWWKDNIHPEDYERVLHEIDTLINTGEHDIHYRFRHKKGNYRYIQDSARIKEYGESGLTQIIGSWLDITEQKTTERKIDRLHRAYTMLSRTNATIIRNHDENELYQQICHIAVEQGGFKLAWVGLVDPGTSLVKVAARAGIDNGYVDKVSASVDDTTERGRGPVGSAVREGRIFVCKDIETDNSFKPWREEALKRGFKSLVAFPLRDNGNIIGALALYAHKANYFDDEELGLLAEMASDLSFGIKTIRSEQARNRAEKQIQKLAYYDPLTELPNLEGFKEKLGKTLKTSRESEHVGVVVFSIARFSEINHALGYDKGDEVLKQVTNRVQQTLWEGSVLCRLSGSKFAVSLPNIAAVDQALLYGKHLLNTLKEPVNVSDIPIDLTVSVGIATFPDYGNDPEALIQHADRACKISKQQAHNITVYNEKLDVDPGRLKIITELRRAIDESELVLYYQPKIDIKSCNTVAVESLIRWQHPDRGMVPPFEFIPIAEKTGLITDITLYVLETALKQCLAWRKEGVNLHVSTNVSAQDIHKEGFYDSVVGLLTNHGFDPKWLILELTESTIMTNPEQSANMLQRLHNLGVKFAIDDFGTGYSSLAYLARLPIDQLKIDKSFVMRMQDNKSDLSIVRSTIDLAHDLGLEVVAEGIEDDSSMEILKNLGCDKGQGFGISPPISAESLNMWLKEGSFPAKNDQISR